MSMPLVSCLMVTRDRPALARTAVLCFASQTWANRELVIVDDGDVDYSPMLASLPLDGLTIRYHRIPHRDGTFLGELRNESIDLSLGEWCIQWDDDEWYHPDRIAVQMRSSIGHAGVALRWTLMKVESARFGSLEFRADAGIATPGTILFRRDAARYPNLRRGEDAVFMRDVRSNGGLEVLGRSQSHLFIRSFHGANTWDEAHFLARLHRRPVDWLPYLSARWLHRDLRRHPACALDDRELDSIRRFAASQRRSADVATVTP